MSNTAQVLEHLKQQIKTRMESKNLTASSVEKKSGLKVSAVRNILAGKSTNPGIETLVAIAEILECSADDLLGIESKNPFSSPTKGHTKKATESHAWNSDLYKDALQVVDKLLAERNISLNVEQVLNIIKEVYLYSISGNDFKADKKFAKWVIENNTKD